MITGTLLFSSSAMQYSGIWQFEAKMCLLVLAAINMGIFHLGAFRSVAQWDEAPARPPLAATPGRRHFAGHLGDHCRPWVAGSASPDSRLRAAPGLASWAVVRLHDRAMGHGAKVNRASADDDRRFMLVDSRSALPQRPTTRVKPDLSGVWEVTLGARSRPGPGMPEQPSLTPEYAQKLADFKARQAQGEDQETPQANCVPPGMPAIMNQPYPMELLFTPGKVTIVIEAYSQTRRIFMDGRKHPDDPDLTYNGHSIGRWDGDTLVVDSVGFTPDTALGPEPGLPAQRPDAHRRALPSDRAGHHGSGDHDR